MSAKVILAVCASALFVQTISAACLGPAPALSYLAAPSPCGPALAAPALSLPALNNIAIPSSGGALGVSSASPFAPSGISLLSQNDIKGTVAVNGAMPFMSAVALEGQVPSAGSGAVSYSCGNGNVGIVSDTLPAASYAAAPLAAAGYGSLGLAPTAYASPFQLGAGIAPGYTRPFAGPTAPSCGCSY